MAPGSTDEDYYLGNITRRSTAHQRVNDDAPHVTDNNGAAHVTDNNGVAHVRSTNG